MLNADDLLFGPAMLLLSGLGAYSDLREHRIPNWLVVIGLSSAFLLNVLYFTSSTTASLLDYALFVFFSAAVSLALWLFDFWKPGDVKFYFTLSTFIHPPSFTDFLVPPAAMMAACLVFAFFEAVFMKKLEFKAPKFKINMLLPVAVSALASLVGLESIWIYVFFAFLGNKLKQLPKPLILAASLFSFIIGPWAALKALATSLVFVLLNSFKFKGEMPSAPFISISFIYLQFFHPI